MKPAELTTEEKAIKYDELMAHQRFLRERNRKKLRKQKNHEIVNNFETQYLSNETDGNTEKENDTEKENNQAIEKAEETYFETKSTEAGEESGKESGQESGEETKDFDA